MSAAACPACGGRVAGGARYCRACGAALPVDDLGPVADPSPLADGPELLGLDGQPAVADTVRRDAPSRWWLAALAAIAVVVTGWAVLGAGGQAEPASDDPATTRPDAATVDSPAPTEEAVGDAPHVSVKGAGPVLGRPVGWSLFLGDPYNPGQGLWRLDLDTGTLVQYPGVDGGPLLAIDDRLVLFDARPGSVPVAGTLQMVPVSDPTTDAVPLGGADLAVASLAVAVPAEPGTGGDFWLYDGAREGARWHLYRSTDGREVDAVDAAPYFEGVLVSGGGPEVVSSASGGVYRRTGREYRRVATGRPIAVRGHDVLVRSCSSPTECTLGWIDRDTGRTVDRPVPPLGMRAPGFVGLVAGSDRYLAALDGGTGTSGDEAVIVDLDTGTLIDSDRAVWPTGSSPDGRYLVLTPTDGSSKLEILDVETGERYELPRPSIGNVVAVFVPNG